MNVTGNDKQALEATALASAFAGVLSALLVLVPSSSNAGPQRWSGGRVVAECTGTEAITIDVDFENNKEGNLDPMFGTVTATLEEHSPGASEWDDTGLSVTMDPVGEVDWPNDPSLLGDTVDVATLTLEDICGSVSVQANAIRVVVDLIVENAKLRKKSGRVFSGRCVSIPNPCQ